MRRGIPGSLETMTREACKGIALAAKGTYLSRDRIRGIMHCAFMEGVQEAFDQKGTEYTPGEP